MIVTKRGDTRSFTFLSEYKINDGKRIDEMDHLVCRWRYNYVDHIILKACFVPGMLALGAKGIT
jgi:hypothetical protein